MKKPDAVFRVALLGFAQFADSHLSGLGGLRNGGRLVVPPLAVKRLKMFGV
jgi:hypothetical protein